MCKQNVSLRNVCRSQHALKTPVWPRGPLWWFSYLRSISVFAVCLVLSGRLQENTLNRFSPSQWIFLPKGHRAERSLDRPSRVPLSVSKVSLSHGFLSIPPLLFPSLRFFSLIPGPPYLLLYPLCSLTKPLSLFLLSLSPVKQIGCSLPQLSFPPAVVCLFFFFAPSDPLVIHFRGCQPYRSRRIQPARFICHCLSGLH